MAVSIVAISIYPVTTTDAVGAVIAEAIMVYPLASTDMVHGHQSSLYRILEIQTALILTCRFILLSIIWPYFAGFNSRWYARRAFTMSVGSRETGSGESACAGSSTSLVRMNGTKSPLFGTRDESSMSLYFPE